jgi:hypothetical protein
VSARGLAALITVVALAAPATTSAGPSGSQAFFHDRLLTDPATSDAVALALKHGGFVVQAVRYRDLTGDDKQDAIVMVDSGGAAGVIALYIFSTDGQKAGTTLRMAYKTQRLQRGATRIRAAGLSFRTSTYAQGDELCCPSAVTERDLRWVAKTGAFKVTAERDVTG